MNGWWFLNRSSFHGLIHDNEGKRTFSTFFKKDRFLVLTIINFEIVASHKYVVQNSKSLWMAKSEKTGHSFLVLIQKWHKLCFENSSCKLLSFNNSTNLSWAWQVSGFRTFQLCMFCGSNFSWIKVQSTSETVYKAFNFNLKLPSVLLKQLAWPSPSTRPRVLNTSMRLCRNECKKSKYWSVR